MCPKLFVDMASKFSKICETIWMTWAFSIVGINYAVVGPTLLDLKLILKQELDTLSTIPLSSGIGETSGMFFTLLLSRLGHKRLQLAVALLLASIVFTIIPVTASYIYVDVMFFVVGFISAIPSCFLMDVCSELWEDKGTTFQFILVGSSLGAIGTPLIVEPFLCHGESPDLSNYSATVLPGLQSQGPGNTSSNSCSSDMLDAVVDGCFSSVNTSSSIPPENWNRDLISCTCTQLMILPSLMNTQEHLSPENDSLSSDVPPWRAECLDSLVRSDFVQTCCELLQSYDQCVTTYGSPVNSSFICTEEDTNVRSAYVILGGVLLPSALAFFYYWLKRNSKWANSSITESQRQDYAQFDVRMSKRKVIVFYIILFLSFFPLTALTIVFATYLTAFGVQGQLQLSKSTMVFMTSVFWLSTLIGRSISTLVTSFLGHTKVIIGNFAGLIVAAVLLVFVAPYNVEVLWLSTVLLGLFACPYEGAGIAWAADYVGMSSNLVLLSWVSVSFGNLLFPFVGGLMFDGIGPTAFLFLLAGMILFIVLMFMVLIIMTKRENIIN